MLTHPAKSLGSSANEDDFPSLQVNHSLFDCILLAFFADMDLHNT